MLLEIRYGGPFSISAFHFNLRRYYTAPREGPKGGEVEMGLKWSSDLGEGSSIWDDEEMKIFYEDLPDLRAKVPAQLLPREEGAAVEPVVGAETAAAGAAVAAAAAAALEGGVEGEAGEEDNEGESAAEGEVVAEEAKPKPTVAEAANTKESEKEKAVSDAKEDAAAGAQHGQKIEAIMARLPGCILADAADSFCVDFCYMSATPSARRRLVRELLSGRGSHSSTSQLNLSRCCP
jgi:regulator of nonsense transcripts 2